MTEQTVVMQVQPVWTNKAIKQMLNELAETRRQLSEAKAENKSHLETIYKFAGDMMETEESLADLRMQYNIVADQRDKLAAESRDLTELLRAKDRVLVELLEKIEMLIMFGRRP